MCFENGELAQDLCFEEGSRLLELRHVSFSLARRRCTYGLNWLPYWLECGEGIIYAKDVLWSEYHDIMFAISSLFGLI